MSCVNATNDADFVPPIWKTKKRIRKLRPGARRIQHPWKHDEVVALIAAVERRRGIWDVASDEYKLSKLDSWREVSKELGSKIDSKEVKLKWSSLRVSFKVNLANYQKKKSAPGADESYTVSWRYFQQMLFLQTNGASQSTRRRSTKKSSSAVTDQSREFVLPTESTTPPVAVDTRRKQQGHVTATPTPPLSPAPSSCLACPVIPKNVAETPDRNAAFCSYLLAELKALSEGRALDLRRALNQTLWNFLDCHQDDTVKQLFATDEQFARPVQGNLDDTADAVDVKMNIFE